MEGVNGLYLRVSGHFPICCWRTFRGVTFLLYYFLLCTRVSMCASVYVASMWRVPILCRVRLRSSAVYEVVDCLLYQNRVEMYGRLLTLHCKKHKNEVKNAFFRQIIWSYQKKVVILHRQKQKTINNNRLTT